MIVAMKFALRFFEPISSSFNEPVNESDVYLVPFSDNLAIVIAIQEIAFDDFWEAVKDPEVIKELLQEKIRLAEGARDKFHASFGKFGVLRAFSSFLVSYLVNPGEIPREVIGMPALPSEKLSTQIDTIISGEGWEKPTPVFQEAASLLAIAEGRYERLIAIKDYIKIFENAFGMSNEGKLILRLESFFKKSQIPAAKSEIKQWFKLRGEDSHAPKRIARFDRPEYDIFLRRLRQAAVDVAYNKRFWNDKSYLREQRVRLSVRMCRDGKFEIDAKTRIDFSVDRDIFKFLRLDQGTSEAEAAAISERCRHFIVELCNRRLQRCKYLLVNGELGSKIRLIDPDASSEFGVHYFWDFGDGATSE